jgi:hypothetical protein
MRHFVPQKAIVQKPMHSGIAVAGTYSVVHTPLDGEKTGRSADLWELVCGFKRSKGENEVEDSWVGRYLRIGKKDIILHGQRRQRRNIVQILTVFTATKAGTFSCEQRKVTIRTLMNVVAPSFSPEQCG